MECFLFLRSGKLDMFFERVIYNVGCVIRRLCDVRLGFELGFLGVG